jgi:hypothetical protein
VKARGKRNVNVNRGIQKRELGGSNVVTGIGVVIGNLSAKGNVNHDDEEEEGVCLFIYRIEATALCEFAALFDEAIPLREFTNKSKRSLIFVLYQIEKKGETEQLKNRDKSQDVYDVAKQIEVLHYITLV